MGRGRQLLADIASLHARTQIVHDPIGPKTLHTLLSIARESKLEVPLMSASVDFVRLVYFAVRGEEVEGRVEEAVLVCDGLG
jgi:hypothetical protein